MTEQFKALGLHNAMYIITWINWLLTAVIFAASRTVTADMQKVAAVNTSA